MSDPTAAPPLSAQPAEPKQPVAPRERSLLEDAWMRMERARAILTGDNPRQECNWGMLDTTLDRYALAAPPAAEPKEPNTENTGDVGDLSRSRNSGTLQAGATPVVSTPLAAEPKRAAVNRMLLYDRIDCLEQALEWIKGDCPTLEAAKGVAIASLEDAEPKDEQVERLIGRLRDIAQEFCEEPGDHFRVLKDAARRIESLYAEVQRLTPELNEYATRLRGTIATLTAERDQLKRERDLAIAHDTQPYPTAWAYEQACKSLETAKGEIARLRDRVERLRGLCKSYSGALVDCDYDPKQRDMLDALIGDMEPPLAALAAERDRAVEALNWLEHHSTLHNRVDILYVVDGYEVEIVSEDEKTLAGPFRGETLLDAILAASQPGNK